MGEVSFGCVKSKDIIRSKVKSKSEVTLNMCCRQFLWTRGQAT